MKKCIIISAFILSALSGMAQEKVMNVHKADGSSSSLRVADLKNISFLTVDKDNTSLSIKKTDGKTTTILFESNPVMTISDGTLLIRSSAPEPTEIGIADIAEIAFGDGSNSINKVDKDDDLVCVVYDNGVTLRGIPTDVAPMIYTIDGRRIATPDCQDGELKLSRATLGGGIFIVKIGSFATKIKL